MGRTVALEQITPFSMFGGAAGADTVGEMLVHAVGHQELCIFGPAVESFSGLDLLLAQRVAMGLLRILLVRRAIAEMAFDNNQARTAGLILDEIEGVQHLLLVIGVTYMEDIPTQAQKAGRNVLGKRDLGTGFQRHAVGIVDPAELVEPEMPGERGCLV